MIITSTYFTDDRTGTERVSPFIITNKWQGWDLNPGLGFKCGVELATILYPLVHDTRLDLGCLLV